jgi:Arc/MetJ family transcription regulator
MRTTLEIDARLLEEAQRVAGIAGKTRVIEHALRELVAAAARRRLAALYGADRRAKAPRRRRPAA